MKRVQIGLFQRPAIMLKCVLTNLSDAFFLNQDVIDFENLGLGNKPLMKPLFWMENIDQLSSSKHSFVTLSNRA